MKELVLGWVLIEGFASREREDRSGKGGRTLCDR